MYLLNKDDSWKKEFDEKPTSRRKVRTIRTTTIEPYLPDYAFFTLAPLYVHAGVRYSMPDQFEIEAKPQNRIAVDYQRMVIGGLGAWGRFVEGIDVEVWEDFCHYLSTCMFVDSGKRQLVWQIRWKDIGVEGTTPQAVVDPKNLPVRMRVFMPDGNRCRMNVKAGYPAKLWWSKPHPTLVEASKKILSCKGRIDHAG